MSRDILTTFDEDTQCPVCGEPITAPSTAPKDVAVVLLTEAIGTDVDIDWTEQYLCHRECYNKAIAIAAPRIQYQDRPNEYVERVYELLFKETLPAPAIGIVWNFNLRFFEDWSAPDFPAELLESEQAEELYAAGYEQIRKIYEKYGIDVDFFIQCLTQYHGDHPVQEWKTYDS